MLKEFFEKFGIKQFFDEGKLIKIGNNYFLVRKNLQDFLKLKPDYVGEKMFWTRGASIIPSLKLLEMIGKNARNKVILSPEGEWLFICGRDLMAKSIEKVLGSPEINDLVAVLNQHQECLGYGLVVAEPGMQKAKAMVIKRVFDVGDFLRRERKSHKMKGTQLF